MTVARRRSAIRRARFHACQNTAAKEVVANLRKDLVARRLRAGGAPLGLAVHADEEAENQHHARPGCGGVVQAAGRRAWGYQTLINATLREAMQQKTIEETLRRVIRDELHSA